MRKAQKQNILEIINTLYEAHKFVKKYIDEKEIDNAQAMMAECQNTVVSLSEIISRSEGEDSSAVKAIEEYYNLLYNVAQEIDNKSNGTKVKKTLDTEINKIGNSVRNDIKVKFEIIFMPYKASMWDSLESVWKAADEDPNCDAYVVPIPYYDRNPDGSFGEFHYEGREFPEYVPIVDYKSYNLEKRLPDTIYIHNPYDGTNLVTSVDPNFYSRELKKYTECLVYIPYFVMNDVDLNDSIAVKGVEHFCLTPGVVNANKVVVQSEKIRQVYINAFLKYIENTLQNKKMLEEKFIGLGSPKFDKVLTTTKENVEIPKEWLKVIQKSNGEYKKVIMYNTSIGALLENNDKMLEKICSVLQFFYENRNDYALLWRPHPLLKATLSSMRPRLWEKYKLIVDKYVSDNWGIYDDSSELNRAISISDAYYGDSSSVVELFREAGKPVMIQNCDITKYKENIQINFEDCEIIDDELWFVAKDFNGIFKLNLNNGELKLIDKIPNELYYMQRLCVKIIHWQDKIIFIPMNARSIWTYSRNEKKWEEITIKIINNNPIYDKFFQAIIYKDSVYMIGAHYPAIIKLNLKTYEIEYFDDIYRGLKERKKELGDCFFRTSIVQKDEHLYLASCVTNQVFKFNLNTCNYEVYEVGDKDNRYSGITYDGKNFWLAPRDNNIVIKWDGNKAYKEILLPDEFLHNDRHFLGIVCDGDKIIMPGIRSLGTVYIDVASELINVMSEQYNFFKIIEKSKLISQNMHGELEIFVQNTNIKILHQIIYNKPDLKDAIVLDLSKTVLAEKNDTLKIFESICYSLDDMCKNIKTKKNTESIKVISDCGNKIHRAILS